MKASELISALLKAIEEHGDHPICIRGKSQSTNYDNEIGEIVFKSENHKATEYMSGRGPFYLPAKFIIRLEE